MTGIDQYGTVIATYTYNALGQRIGINDSGTQTWTVYNGKSADANPYADFTSSGSVTMRYVDGLAVDELLARTSSSGTTAWYITDKLGSVEDVVSTQEVSSITSSTTLRQHHEPDQRDQRRPVHVRGDGIRLGDGALLRSCALL